MGIYIIVTALMIIFVYGSMLTNKSMTRSYDYISDPRRIRNMQRLLLIMFVLLLLLMWGLRMDGGADDKEYKLFYEKGYGLYRAKGRLLTGKEPIFVVLVRLGKALGYDYSFLFFGYSAVTTVFLVLALREYKLYTEELLIYILGFMMFVYTSIFTVMRQAAAMAVILYYYSLDKKKRKKHVIWLLPMAFISHYSVLAAAIIEVLRRMFKNDLSKKSVKILLPLIALALARVLNFELIIEKITSMFGGIYEYMNYSGNFNNQSNVGILLILSYIAYILKILMSDKRVTFGADTEKTETVEQLQTIYFTLAFLMSYLRWGSRLQLFYLMFIPFILVDLVNCILKNQRRMASLIVSIFIELGFIYVLIDNTNLYAGLVIFANHTAW